MAQVTTLDWLLLSVPLVLIWVPALLIVGSDLVAFFRRKRNERRLASYMRDQAWAYRELDLTEPRRPRLGIHTEEEE